MSRLGFNKSVVYHGEVCLGELDVVPVRDRNFQFPNGEIRIHHLSQLSERCPPLSVLLTISSFSVRCKLESSSPVKQPQLIDLHASCFYELKTAVVLLGDEEVHLVAMPSKLKKFPCFWCCVVPSRLYNACLGMLNMRCLAIVFDLDETLIVANTMKSFEDRIEFLNSRISYETDPIRRSGMTSELKRYVEDRELLKQYIEADSVADNGKVYNVKLEEVAMNIAGNERVVRPVIRVPEKNIVLTRINPEIRDTSVLVRLRPAWEDLRSYLIAKGRKRFEVYVCTMAERDYALEMWRLLDPEAHLIGSKQLLNRVVCVKSGARKSLFNVFQDGNCHPRMAMVIDDRLKVWEEMDQPRVHVVPAFTPYYAPQAETANAVPVLCVARNVACNVRGGFFKEFDENLLRRLSELFYEDEVLNLPAGPDVCNYLMSEDASFVPNGNANAPVAEGMNGTEVAQRLNVTDTRNVASSASNASGNGVEMKSDKAPQSLPAPNIHGSANFKSTLPSEKPSLLGAPFRRDNSFAYRGSGEPPLLSRLPVQPAGQPVQPRGGWLEEEDRASMNIRASGTVQGYETLMPNRQRASHNPLSHGTSSSVSAGYQTYASEAKGEEAFHGCGSLKKNLPPTGQLSDSRISANQSSYNGEEIPTEVGKLSPLQRSLAIGVLQEIGHKCGAKIEFRSIMSSSKDLQFSFEVLYSGDKIAVGMGKTRKDAQQQAAENALRNLADHYLSFVAAQSAEGNKDSDKVTPGMENGFLWDEDSTDSDESPVKDGLPVGDTSEAVEVTSSSNSASQQIQKRVKVNSPRLAEANPSERSKEDPLQSSKDLSSSGKAKE